MDKKVNASLPVGTDEDFFADRYGKAPSKEPVEASVGIKGISVDHLLMPRIKKHQDSNPFGALQQVH